MPKGTGISIVDSLDYGIGIGGGPDDVDCGACPSFRKLISSRPVTRKEALEFMIATLEKQQQQQQQQTQQMNHGGDNDLICYYSVDAVRSIATTDEELARIDRAAEAGRSPVPSIRRSPAKIAQPSFSDRRSEQTKLATHPIPMTKQDVRDTPNVVPKSEAGTSDTKESKEERKKRKREEKSAKKLAKKEAKKAKKEAKKAKKQKVENSTSL